MELRSSMANERETLGRGPASSTPDGAYVPHGRNALRRQTKLVAALGAALLTVVAVSCGGASDEATGPPIDAGIQRVALIGERPHISDVLVDGYGCVIAGTPQLGVGEHPEVWTGVDCVSALQPAGDMTGVTGPGPGAWTEAGQMTEGKTMVSGVVRTLGDTGLLGVGYVEEHSDLFPTSARIFRTGANPQFPNAPDKLMVVVSGGMSDPDGIVLNDVERVSGGRLIVAGARRFDGGSRPLVWWSDDELGVMREVELPTTPGGWTEAKGVFVRPDGRVLVSGSRIPTGIVYDEEGVIWFSDDLGATWQEATHDGSFAGPVQVVVADMAEVSSGLIAVGYSYGGGKNEAPLMWRSDDGALWSRFEQGPTLDGPGVLSAVIAKPDGAIVTFGGTIEVLAEPGRESKYLGYAWEQTPDGWTTRALGDERPTLATSSGAGWVAIGPGSLWSTD